MYKIYKVFIAAFLLHTSVAHASSVIDSIGVENYNGKKLILHKVEAKETYYSISKRYNVNYKDVMTFNDSKFLQIGVVLKVPTSLPFTASSTTASVTNTSNGAVIDYTVKAKDNLNMLAEKYGTTVNEIKRINGLNSINLQIGQQLKILTNGNTVEQESTPVVSAFNPTKPVGNTENTTGITHTIKAKENLNLLAEKYGTTVDEIKRLNGLSSNNLQIGQVLKIPSGSSNVAEASSESTKTASTPPANIPPVKNVQKPVAEPVTPPSNNPPAENGFEHTVVAGETIYTIAKRYNLTTFQIKTWNNLQSNDLSTGQKLIIRGAKPVTASSDEEQGTEANGNTIKDPTFKGSPSKYGLTQIDEKGTALWITDPDLDPTKMLVLHRSAPVGTIIKITNPMSNRSAFAKVVGKFTENENTKDVIIVMTKAVADAVGALDKRFFCNINYGAQENEQ